ncbi:MAG: glycosyltransferase [Kiritimatiellae bacterium]|nr:glycosyltransferase [Kiritimatiellia bacterium]
MRSPAVSAIVPVYNMPERQADCLDSLLAPTLQELKIILINNDSSDNAGAICRQYAGEHEHIRLHEGENHGVSTAYNIGLDMARGDFVAFCDSDDFVAPTMYQVMYEQAVANHADISCCHLRCGRNRDELRANAPALMDGATNDRIS